MKINKLLRLVMSAVLVFSFLTVNVYANTGMVVGESDSVSAIAVEGESRDGIFIMPRESIHLGANHTGGAYYGYFSCSPNSGKTLNIYVYNKSSQPVMFAVEGGGTTHSTVQVSGNSGLTRTFVMTDGSGISGDWKVYVYNTQGYSLDLQVNARQF